MNVRARKERAVLRRRRRMEPEGYFYYGRPVTGYQWYLLAKWGRRT